jgi:hypothetical protein
MSLSQGVISFVIMIMIIINLLMWMMMIMILIIGEEIGIWTHIGEA